MNLSASRIALLGVAMAVSFGIIAAVLLRLMPLPHKDTDYLVVGALATFGALGVLFLMLLATTSKPSAPSKPKE
ncbi:MAG: hypothetical protein R2729_22050 [Bryobacteraceae bacterium]